MSTLELTYFDSPGRAEPIRMALHFAGLPFTDRRLKFPEFGAAKARGEFPLGSVPVLRVDGLVIAQTAAILRYVARSGAPDLYPSEPLAALVVDSVLETFNDTLSNALAPSFWEKDQEKKLAMRAALVAGPMALAFRYVDELVGRGPGPFVSGAALSIADMVVGQQLVAIRAGVLDGVAPALVDEYPRLAALLDAYLAEPRVAAYRAR